MRFHVGWIVLSVVCALSSPSRATEFKGATVIEYPSPSATLITDQTARLTAFITPGATDGIAFLDLGPSSGEMTQGLAQHTLTNSPYATPVNIDTMALVQGTTYRWRFRVVTASGLTVEGAEQTFTTLPGEFSLSVRNSTGGEAQVDPVLASYPPGAQVSVTAMPFHGYRFIQWTLDGQLAGSENPFSLTMSRSHVLAPQFAPELEATDGGVNVSGGSHVTPAHGCSAGLNPLGWLALLGLPMLLRRAVRPR